MGRDRAATEVVTPPDRSAAREHTSVPDRHGGMRWRASSEPQTSIARSRCPADAGEIRAPVFKRTEERLSRRGSNRRGGAAPDDEIRRYQDGRPARLAGAAPGARTAGQPAHGIINQIRAFLLERGVAVRQGLRFLRTELPASSPQPADGVLRRQTRRVDGLTWPTYEADLDRNLTDLHERVHRGAYRALAVTAGIHS